MLQLLKRILGKAPDSDFKWVMNTGAEMSSIVSKCVEAQFMFAEREPTSLFEADREVVCGYVAGFSDVYAQACPRARM